MSRFPLAITPSSRGPLVMPLSFRIFSYDTTSTGPLSMELCWKSEQCPEENAVQHDSQIASACHQYYNYNVVGGGGCYYFLVFF
jgi:hypothetical protein